jgi:predicted ATPase/serine/threonine protein kinase
MNNANAAAACCRFHWLYTLLGTRFQLMRAPPCYIPLVELRIGSTVGDYIVESFVAEGGMSLIYTVRHLEHGTLHALKILAIHTRSVRDRMQQEGHLQRLLQHPNIVPVTDVLQLPHGPALVMDYVAGPDLAELLERCALTDTQVDHLVRGILRGMIAAHANGMVHRDLKPSNILLEIQDGSLTPRIADFGLAKMWSADDDRPLTQTGTIMGTPSYMAPEQIWDSSSVDERADVFSLGTVLYEMLSGKRAFEGGHNVEVWSRITSGKRVPLDQLRTDLPPEVIRTVHRAMAIDRDQRTPTVQSLLTKWEQAWAPFSPAEITDSEVWRGKALDEANKWVEKRSLEDAQGPRSRGPSGDAAATFYPYVQNEALEGSTPTDIVKMTTPLHYATSGIRTPPPGNLPAQGDRFIGRSTELGLLQERLKSDRPILTLSGPGGMGKTRLSLKFGELNRSGFPGGVWFCDLTASQSQQDILRTVAQSLGVPLCEKKPVVQLAHAISGRGRALIILDNMEQVVKHAADTVGVWAVHAPEARFIVTSRIQMGLQSEQIFELEPIDTEEGIEIFEERSRHLNPDYSLSPEDRTLVGEIVERVDGMSLAIELAAARTQMLSPKQILQRLDQRFRLLSSGRQDQTARQSTLEGAIDWSWDLLEPVDRAALAQCSIFRGGFTLQAAEEVLDLQSWDDWPMDAVQRLVEKSLVRSTEPHQGQIRFQLYESIREYAHGKLRTPGSVVNPEGHDLTGPGAVAAIGLRHSAFYAKMGDEQVLESRFWGGQPEVRLAFRLECDNLAQAIAFGRHGPPTVHAQATVAWAAIHRWYGPYLPAIDVVKDTMNRKDLDPRSRLQLVETAGELYAHAEQMDQAEACADECIALARMLKDPSAQGRALSRHTHYTRRTLSNEEILAAQDEALVMLRTGGDWRSEVDALLCIGSTYMSMENLDAGMRLADEVLEMSLAGECLWQEALSLRFRAALHMDTGRMDLAEQDLKRAMDNAHRIEKPMLLIEVNGGLGTLYKDLGRLEESVERHETGIQISREVGNRRRESILMGNLALILQLQDKPKAAQQMYEDTVRLDDTRGRTVIGHMAMGNLGDLLLSQGKLEESTEHLTTAIENLNTIRPSMAGAFRGSLAWVRAQLGEFDAARELLEQGEAQVRDVWVVELGRLLCRRAQVEHLAACPDKAEAALAEAKEIAEKLGGSSDSDLGQMITETEGMLSA